MATLHNSEFRQLCVGNDDARRIDKKAIEDLNIPGIQLMEEAGTQAARYTIAYCHKHAIRRALVFCGKGNNGGDGYVIARELHAHYFQVTCICPGSEKMITGDALHHYQLMKSAGTPIRHISDANEIHPLLEKPGIWIDALLGTGIHSDLNDPIKSLLQTLVSKRMNHPVVAVDIPSGLDGTTGFRHGAVLAATFTVSMGFRKWGHYLNGARHYCGHILDAPLSYPPEASAAAVNPATLITDEFIKDRIRPVDPDSHKYTRGQVTIVGGSRTMPGAPLLSGRAALNSGCGMLHYFCAPSILPTLAAAFPEALFHISANEDALTEDDIPQLKSLIKKTSAWCVGPGLGRNPRTGDLLHSFLPDLDAPLCIDADALYFLSAEVLSALSAPVVITPHAGEFGRLFGFTAEEIRDKGPELAREAARSTGTVIHLKGAGSITAAPDGRLFVHSSGNPGMATAGSGDVLAGMIASFCAQGQDVLSATLIAAHLHGRAGDLARQSRGLRSMLASDIINALPSVLMQFDSAN